MATQDDTGAATPQPDDDAFDHVVDEAANDAYAESGVEKNDLPDGFMRGGSADGSTRILVKRKKPTGGEEWRPICGDFTARAMMRSADGGAWSTEIVFRDFDGNAKTEIVPQALIEKPGELREFLRARGLWLATSDADKKDFLRLLANYHPKARVTTYERPGFFGLGADDAVHVSPTGAVTLAASAVEDGSVAASEHRLTRPTRDQGTAGTFEAWQEGANAICTNPDLPHVALGIFTGCAGTLIQAADLDSSALAFIGPSSMGKSTAQAWGGSCWANPAIDKGVVLSLKGTVNSMDYVYPISTGASVHMDEGAVAEAKDIVQLGFHFATEAGKKRMTSDLRPRPVPVWKGFMTLSAEKSLSVMALEARMPRITGSAVRLVSVPVDDVKPIDPAEARRLKRVAFENYGWAGPRFVEAVFARGWHLDRTGLRALVGEGASKLVEMVEADRRLPAVARAAEVFGLLRAVGHVMVEAGILTVPVERIEAVVAWSWQAFLNSPDARALWTAEDGVESLIQWLKSNPGKVRFHGDTSANQEVVAWYRGDTVYLPVGNIGKMGLSAGEGAILAKLSERSLLIPQSDKNRVWRKGLGGVKHYRIKLTIEPSQEDKRQEAIEDGVDPVVAPFMYPGALH